MPTRVTPCRTQVSDRFPVASFVVQVPSDRYFELAFATDPQLFHASRRNERSVTNFHTSRQSGLMRAPAGEATYLVPGPQLQRFAGRQRIYYAIATFASPRGDDPRTSVPFDRLKNTPYIQLSADFTGRSLDRSRLSGLLKQEPAYGARAPDLAWGGDLVTGATARADELGYDDGYDPTLWRGGAPEANVDDDGVPAYAQSQEEPWGSEDPAASESDEEWGEPYAYGNPEPAVHAETYGSVGSEPADDAEAQAPELDHVPAEGAYGAPQPLAEIDDPYGVFERPNTYGSWSTSAHAEPLGHDTEASDAHGHVSAFDGPGYDADDEEAGFSPPATDPAAWDSAADAWTPALDVDETQEPPTDGWQEDDGYGGVDDGNRAVESHPGDRGDGGVAGALLPLGHPKDPHGAAPFDPVARSRILYAVAGLDEAADPFTSLREDEAGLRWGLGSFDQRSGALGRVLQRCQDEDAAAFDLIFGPNSTELIDRTSDLDEGVRMGAVGGEPLSSDTWRRRFERASEERAFRKAQLKEAVQTEIDPQARIAGRLGLHNDRAFAALIDRSRQAGTDTAQAEFADALCPVKAIDVQQGRLDDLERALLHLGIGPTYGTIDERLEAFQQSNGDFSGTFGPQTQALLVQALRESPCPGLDIPQGDAMIGALQSYGAPADRLSALWATPQLCGEPLALAEV